MSRRPSSRGSLRGGVPALASLLLPLLLLLASAATGCIVVAPGAQRTDWPDVVDVDAGCDSAGWWDLWA